MADRGRSPRRDYSPRRERGRDRDDRRGRGAHDRDRDADRRRGRDEGERGYDRRGDERRGDERRRRRSRSRSRSRERERRDRDRERRYDGEVYGNSPARQEPRQYDGVVYGAAARAAGGRGRGDSRGREGSRGPKEAAPAPDAGAQADLTQIDVDGEDPEAAMAAMAAAMGLPVGFDTTQDKDHTATDASAVHRKTTRTARQYMNRKGGFNRDLPAERTGEKVRKEGLRLA
ncbi:unnamed protein product [Pedinophyceae sp. YPF-701]|nr:unnamed protein product [Pedinophyceae sp. YPF-701]